MYMIEVDIIGFPDRTATRPPYDYSEKINIGPTQSQRYAILGADRLRTAIREYGKVSITRQGKSSFSAETPVGVQIENLIKRLTSKRI